MKKIISLIAAVAMMSTMFVATASAEVANATLKIVPTKLTDAEFVEIMAESIPDGYEAYTLDVSVAGLGELSVTNTGTAKRPVYSGRRINNFNLELDFDKLENVNTTYTCANETVLCATSELSSDTFDGKVYKFLFNAGSAAAAYPNTFGTTIAADADVESICNILVVVKAGTVVTPKLVMGIETYPAAVTPEYVKDDNKNVTYSPATLTLGSTTPTGPSYSITKEYKDAANKGYVWDVTISDFNTTKNSAMANFKVSDDEKVSAEITGLDGIESDGSCNFAVILNTEKTLAATDGFTITFPAK